MGGLEVEVGVEGSLEVGVEGSVEWEILGEGGRRGGEGGGRCCEGRMVVSARVS